MKVVEASSLVEGDRFEYAGTGVTVLRDPEGWGDTFGRDMVRVWATRHDTGAEGWIVFGPLALVEAHRGADCRPETCGGVDYDPCGGAS